MIKGKAKMEFGTGDIRMTGALSNGIGALCCITQIPHEIGEKVPVEDTWNVDQAEVILTFSRTESIDALIAELQDVKAMMNGTYPVEKTDLHENNLDFDAFMKNDISLNLPCNVGDTVYKLWYKPCHNGEEYPDSYSCCGCEDECDLKRDIFEFIVPNLEWIIQHRNSFDGTVWFTTREAAKEKLDSLNGKKEMVE